MPDFWTYFHKEACIKHHLDTTGTTASDITQGTQVFKDVCQTVGATHREKSAWIAHLIATGASGEAGKKVHTQSRPVDVPEPPPKKQELPTSSQKQIQSTLTSLVFRWNNMPFSKAEATLFRSRHYDVTYHCPEVMPMGKVLSRRLLDEAAEEVEVKVEKVLKDADSGSKKGRILLGKNFNSFLVITSRKTRWSFHRRASNALISWINNHSKVRKILDECQAIISKDRNAGKILILAYLVADLTRWTTHFIVFLHLFTLRSALQLAVLQNKSAIIAAEKFEGLSRIALQLYLMLAGRLLTQEREQTRNVEERLGVTSNTVANTIWLIRTLCGTFSNVNCASVRARLPPKTPTTAAASRPSPPSRSSPHPQSPSRPSPCQTSPAAFLRRALHRRRGPERDVCVTIDLNDEGGDEAGWRNGALYDEGGADAERCFCGGCCAAPSSSLDVGLGGPVPDPPPFALLPLACAFRLGADEQRLERARVRERVHNAVDARKAPSTAMSLGEAAATGGRTCATCGRRDAERCMITEGSNVRARGQWERDCDWRRSTEGAGDVACEEPRVPGREEARECGGEGEAGPARKGEDGLLEDGTLGEARREEAHEAVECAGGRRGPGRRLGVAGVRREWGRAPSAGNRLSGLEHAHERERKGGIGNRERGMQVDRTRLTAEHDVDRHRRGCCQRIEVVAARRMRNHSPAAIPSLCAPPSPSPALTPPTNQLRPTPPAKPGPRALHSNSREPAGPAPESVRLPRPSSPNRAPDSTAPLVPDSSRKPPRSAHLPKTFARE
ncbi:hypothetical protein B0H10DRAFT_1940899 [Mycena sp. CBHHK59/15]|nr:hypothetical protein B0H10DRAFT_1940899 [Mycena sp. CBHHK59/15]